MARLKPSRHLQTPAQRLRLQQAVEKAEQDIAAGNWIEHSDIVRNLTAQARRDRDAVEIDDMPETDI